MLFGSTQKASGPQLVHKPMRRAWVSVATCTFALIMSVTLCMMLGCGTDGVSPQANNATSTEPVVSEAAAAQVESVLAVKKKLQGVWLGAAYLDEATLAARLKELPQAQVDNIMNKAQFFAGTVMAINFRPDGTLENEIEITPPNGPMINEVGEGTWKVVEISDDSFIVEIVEYNPDGSVTTSQKAYKFYEDGNHFAVSIPLEDVLGDCNPLIIFERQNLGTQQGMLAETPGDTETR